MLCILVLWRRMTYVCRECFDCLLNIFWGWASEQKVRTKTMCFGNILVHLHLGSCGAVDHPNPSAPGAISSAVCGVEHSWVWRRSSHLLRSIIADIWLPKQSLKKKKKNPPTHSNWPLVERLSRRFEVLELFLPNALEVIHDYDFFFFRCAGKL